MQAKHIIHRSSLQSGYIMTGVSDLLIYVSEMHVIILDQHLFVLHLHFHHRMFCVSNLYFYFQQQTVISTL